MPIEPSYVLSTKAAVPLISCSHKQIITEGDSGFAILRLPPYILFSFFHLRDTCEMKKLKRSQSECGPVPIYFLHSSIFLGPSGFPRHHPDAGGGPSQV
jgi:hypothetical protein